MKVASTDEKETFRGRKLLKLMGADKTRKKKTAGSKGARAKKSNKEKKKKNLDFVRIERSCLVSFLRHGAVTRI